jgi:formylglycine-generating enzyme required for sulfatase activity
MLSRQAGIEGLVLREAALAALVAFEGRVRQAATEYERRDEAAWRVATAANTKAAYEAYLADFARGANTAEALERIAAIDAASARQADDQAWAAAQRTDTKAAYEAYLRAQPSGRHAASAAAKITEIDRLAARGPGTAFRDKFTSGSGQGPEMVVLPAGSFTMGSPEGEAGRTFDEGPQRTVRISYEFAVGKHEVTFADWDACVANGGCGGHRPNDRDWGRSNHPVINVSWSDAQSFVAWLNQKTGLTGRADRYRLLSEAEWEYAARAGSQAPWSFGDDESRLGRFAWFDENSEARTQPVGGKTANAFSLHDMHGNVWEWVEDTDGWNYRNAPSDGSARLTSNIYRVVRGGSWNNSAKELRSAYRYIFTPGSRKINVGFRVARTLPP